jgi:hypothetical protein
MKFIIKLPFFNSLVSISSTTNCSINILLKDENKPKNKVFVFSLSKCPFLFESNLSNLVFIISIKCSGTKSLF